MYATMTTVIHCTTIEPLTTSIHVPVQVLASLLLNLFSKLVFSATFQTKKSSFFEIISKKKI